MTDLFDSIVALVPHLPGNWPQIAAWCFGVAVAIRTGLRVVAGAASALDVAIDGKVDWAWPDKVERFCVWADSWLARLPVKAPFLLERREHAQPANVPKMPEARP